MELFEQLCNSATLITPNRRLSATLLKKHHQFQISKGKSCWASLDILPFSSWIQRYWQAFTAEKIASAPLILTSQQEQVIWEEILQKSPTNDSLLQLSATADLSKSAWGILKQWRVELDHPLLIMTEDSRAFLQWAQHFQQLNQQNNWLDAHSLTNLITEQIEQKVISLPQQIIVIGFTELSPQQKRLFDICEAVGTEVTYLEHQPSLSSNHQGKSLISLADAETEIHTMARWAKALLENKTPTSTLTIGCVVPNLDQIRDRVSQLFAEVFSENHYYSLDYTNLEFNISAGKSLSTFPIIHAALKLLNLNMPSLAIETISAILRSPFIGEAEKERIQRANFDSRLRNANITTFSLKKLLDNHGKFNLGNYSPSLAKRIEKFQTQLANLQKTYTIDEWVKIFMECLAILGWPGERSLNSQEYQIVQRWLDLLQEYRAFDSFLTPQTYQGALHYLIRLTTKTIFQPESKDAPVQILGMLEAAEIPFDYLWVMGLDDTTWPPSAKPNPFIPLRLQKMLQMPHATADRELDYSTRLTTQLKQGAKNVIFSHALKNGDCELRPSALIKYMTAITLAELHLSHFTSPAQHIYASRKLESIHDEQAPPIGADEPIRGGVSIFKQQAACPFKAFAEIRLNARPLESPILGLRAQDRGTIIHKALELIWQTLKNSTYLSNLPDSELRNLLDDSIAAAIQRTTGEEIKNLRYLTLEAERLKIILWNWLQIEKKRPAFKVISHEQERTIVIGQISVSLRVDRVDELNDQSHLIIDYKTGKNNQLKYWFSDRPEEPQLPLYCITHNLETTGIAFAEIHADNLSLKGISKKNLDIDGIKPLYETNYAEKLPWEQQIQRWHMILEKIGNDFYQGKAEVAPKDLIETCRYCHLQALCRIHENKLGQYE